MCIRDSGYPADLLGWLLSVEGERFEYESNLLFEAKRAGVRVVEIPIQTCLLYTSRCV